MTTTTTTTTPPAVAPDRKRMLRRRTVELNTPADTMFDFCTRRLAELRSLPDRTGVEHVIIKLERNLAIAGAQTIRGRAAATRDQATQLDTERAGKIRQARVVLADAQAAVQSTGHNEEELPAMLAQHEALTRETVQLCSAVEAIGKARTALQEIEHDPRPGRVRAIAETLEAQAQARDAELTEIERELAESSASSGPASSVPPPEPKARKRGPIVGEVSP